MRVGHLPTARSSEKPSSGPDDPSRSMAEHAVQRRDVDSGLLSVQDGALGLGEHPSPTIQSVVKMTHTP